MRLLYNLNVPGFKYRKNRRLSTLISKRRADSPHSFIDPTRPGNLTRFVAITGRDTAFDGQLDINLTEIPPTLSKSFAPPTLGLRGARLIDDHGQTSHADLPANHRDPYDVNEPELDYYFDVWGFLPPTELLFYAFSVIRYAAKHDEPTVYLERWIETIDGKLAMIVGDCDAKQESSLKRMLAEQLNIVSVFELEAIFSYISDS